MHKLEDNVLITPTLLKRCLAEAQFMGADGRHLSYVQRSNGDILENDDLGPVGEGAAFFATEMLTSLNDELHHDGAWVIVFTNYVPPRPPEASGHYKRFVLMWMDEDGDVRFPIEFEGRVEEAMEMGLVHWLQSCEGAWHLWKYANAALDARPQELYRRALGEKPPSVH